MDSHCNDHSHSTLAFSSFSSTVHIVVAEITQQSLFNKDFNYWKALIHNPFPPNWFQCWSGAVLICQPVAWEPVAFPELHSQVNTSLSKVVTSLPVCSRGLSLGQDIQNVDFSLVPFFSIYCLSLPPIAAIPFWTAYLFSSISIISGVAVDALSSTAKMWCYSVQVVQFWTLWCSVLVFKQLFSSFAQLLMIVALVIQFHSNYPHIATGTLLGQCFME